MGYISFQDVIKKSKPAIGGSAHIPANEAIEILGYAGYKMAFIDNEHTPFGTAMADQMILAAHAVNVCAVVRVSCLDREETSHVLDSGAGAVVFPNMHTADDVKTAVSYTKYAPMGVRGACPNVRCAKHSLTNLGHYSESNNVDTAIALIESLAGVKNIGEILDVPGLAGIYLGPYDLSVDMGLDGQVYHPDVMAKLEEAFQAAKSKKIPVGIYERDFEKAKYWLLKGMDYMFYNTDVTILAKFWKEALAELEKI